MVSWAALITLWFRCCNLFSHPPYFQAQRYQALIDDLHQHRLQLSLAELYHNERGIGAIGDMLRRRQHAAAATNNKLVNWEQMVKAHKKEHGRLSREQQHIEKEIRCVHLFLCLEPLRPLSLLLEASCS